MEQFIELARWSTVSQVVVAVIIVALFWVVLKLRKDIRDSTNHRIDFGVLNLEEASALIAFVSQDIYSDVEVLEPFDVMLKKEVVEAGFDGPVIILPDKHVELAVLSSGLGEPDEAGA